MISVRPLELAFVDVDAAMELAVLQVSSSIRRSQLRFWRMTWKVDQSSSAPSLNFDSQIWVKGDQYILLLFSGTLLLTDVDSSQTSCYLPLIHDQCSRR